MKRLNKKGFTMAELLIVVAIIAILVAIAIPVFTGQLEKAKEATDEANIRSAYAEAVTNKLSDDVAYPTSYDASKYGNLNYSGKLTWTVDTTGLTITYDAVKIDDLSLNAAN